MGCDHAVCLINIYDITDHEKIIAYIHCRQLAQTFLAGAA